MNNSTSPGRPSPSIDWQPFRQEVQTRHSFVLTSHIRPDCDALGSELGMARVLLALGKDVWIVNGQATPSNLEFIDPERMIRVVGDDVSPADVQRRDAVIVLDTSAWVQLGPMADVVRAFSGCKLLIDHHVSEDDLGAHRFKDATAEATGRLVVEAADALGVALDASMADPLFAALATDTGWFRFGSTSPATYELAGRLMAAGANPPAIYNALYERDTLGRLRLRGLILSRTVTELGGRLAHTYVTNEDYAAVGAEPSDTEDVINQTLTVAGTEFSVIFVGLIQGGYKISFRSRCAIDCSQIAQMFQGGGHKAAAGATLPGTLAEVQESVLRVVRDALTESSDA